MERASSDIWLSDLTQEILDTTIEINLGATRVNIRQFMVCVGVTQSQIKDAELLVTVEGLNIPRAIRRPVSERISWDLLLEPTCESVRRKKGESQEDFIPRAVHSVLCKRYERPLKAGWTQYATVFYTIEGYDRLFLTTEKPTALPLHAIYDFELGLAGGEGLHGSKTELAYIEADAWNKIYAHHHFMHIHSWRRLKRLGLKKWLNELVRDLFSPHPDRRFHL
jgi:hypothetical protein